MCIHMIYNIHIMSAMYIYTVYVNCRNKVHFMFHGNIYYDTIFSQRWDEWYFQEVGESAGNISVELLGISSLQAKHGLQSEKICAWKLMACRRRAKQIEHKVLDSCKRCLGRVKNCAWSMLASYRILWLLLFLMLLFKNNPEHRTNNLWAKNSPLTLYPQVIYFLKQEHFSLPVFSRPLSHLCFSEYK